MGPRLMRVIAIFVIAMTIPAVLAIPAAACRPAGGELPGINCLPHVGLALPGSWLYALLLGARLGSRGPPAGWPETVAAVMGVAAGTYVGLRLVAAGQVSFMHGAVNLATLALPLVGFAIGWLAGLALVVVRRRTRGGRPGR